LKNPPPFDKGGEGDLNLPQPLFTKEGRNKRYKGRRIKKGARGI